MWCVYIRGRGAVYVGRRWTVRYVPSKNFLVFWNTYYIIICYNDNMILHKANDTVAFFWCPGCDEAHQIHYAGDRAWGFNGNWEAPTFTPSYLTWADPKPEVDAVKFPKYHNGFRCHSFITDGKIAYLDDCTHDLKGQTVDLPEWPLD